MFFFSIVQQFLAIIPILNEVKDLILKLSHYPLLARVFWKCYKSIIYLEDRTMAKSVIIYTQPG